MSELNESLSQEMRQAIDQAKEAVDKIREQENVQKGSVKNWMALIELRNEIIDLIRVRP